MNSRNIPLNALRVFEAASRHLSFTKAAEELHVTQAAVSQQIRTLEKQLDLKLFIREKRSLRLTSAGSELAEETRSAIHRLQQTIARLTDTDEIKPLTISTLSSFGSRWLIPRLARFQEQHADIQLLVQTVDQKVDLFGTGVDAAIRWNPGDHAGLVTNPLMNDASCLVCATSLADELEKNPSTLAEQTMIVDSNLLQDRSGKPIEYLTTEYLATTLELDHESLKVLSFTQSDNVVVSALAGHGLALTRISLCADEIADGKLKVVHDFFHPFDTGYALVYPEHRARDHRLKAFRAWLLAEAEQFCSRTPMTKELV